MFLFLKHQPVSNRFCRLLFLAAIAIHLTTPAGWSKNPVNPEASYPSQPTENSSLGAIHYFRLSDKTNTFSGREEAFPIELIEYIRSNMLSSSTLIYDASGQDSKAGILSAHCLNKSCNTIKAVVTLGEEGASIWETTQTYHQDTWLDLWQKGDARVLAKDIVEKLAQDYQKELNSTISKIEIIE